MLVDESLASTVSATQLAETLERLGVTPRFISRTNLLDIKSLVSLWDGYAPTIIVPSLLVNNPLQLGDSDCVLQQILTELVNLKVRVVLTGDVRGAASVLFNSITGAPPTIQSLHSDALSVAGCHAQGNATLCTQVAASTPFQLPGTIGSISSGPGIRCITISTNSPIKAMYSTEKAAWVLVAKTGASYLAFDSMTKANADWEHVLGRTLQVGKLVFAFA